MIDSTSIAKLEERIGFGLMEIAVPVAPTHRVGTSGRTLPGFHKLANLDNIYNTAEPENMTAAEFDAYLAQMKKDTVLSVITQIFKHNPKYLEGKDYSYLIDKYPLLFDEAIGYSLAVAALELAVTTKRSNDNERNARLSYSNLKIELEGAKDGFGNTVSVGLKRTANSAIKRVAGILFPSNLIIESPKLW